MEPSSSLNLSEILLIAGICMATGLVGAIALLIVAARQIASIEVPEDADFFETLQSVPITVPLALDLLDLAFDIFSAPVSWIVLELLGLQALQLVTVFEGLIPGTQLIPTLTIAWFLARGMRKKRRTELRSALQEYQTSQRQARYGQLGSGQALADQYRSKPLLGPGEDIEEGEYFEEDLDEPPPDYFEEEEAGY